MYFKDRPRYTSSARWPLSWSDEYRLFFPRLGVTLEIQHELGCIHSTDVWPGWLGLHKNCVLHQAWSPPIAPWCAALALSELPFATVLESAQLRDGMQIEIEHAHSTFCVTARRSHKLVDLERSF